MKHMRTLSQGLFVGLFVVLGAFAVAAEPAVPGNGQSETASTVAGGTPGMVIYVDPKTGAFLKEPAPGTVPLHLTPQLSHALSTSHHGLVETPSPVPGGGFKLDLQGRFQNPLFATIDADGTLRIKHLRETPAPADSH
jgi:hypothetical protein